MLNESELVHLVALETLKGLLRDPGNAAIPANARGFLEVLSLSAERGFEAAEGQEGLAALRIQITQLDRYVRGMALRAAQAWRPGTFELAERRAELISLLVEPINSVVPVRARALFTRIQDIRGIGVDTPKGQELLSALRAQLSALDSDYLCGLRSSVLTWQPSNEIDKIQLDELLQFLSKEQISAASIRPLGEIQRAALKIALRDVV